MSVFSFVTNINGYFDVFVRYLYFFGLQRFFQAFIRRLPLPQTKKDYCASQRNFLAECPFTRTHPYPASLFSSRGVFIFSKKSKRRKLFFSFLLVLLLLFLFSCILVSLLDYYLSMLHKLMILQTHFQELLFYSLIIYTHSMHTPVLSLWKTK